MQGIVLSKRPKLNVPSVKHWYGMRRGLVHTDSCISVWFFSVLATIPPLCVVPSSLDSQSH